MTMFDSYIEGILAERRERLEREEAENMPFKDIYEGKSPEEISKMEKEEWRL